MNKSKTGSYILICLVCLSVKKTLFHNVFLRNISCISIIQKKWGNIMDIGKTLKQVTAAIAVVSAFAALPQEALLLCVLGLACGWYMAEGDTIRVLVTAAALNVGGVAGGANAIPTVGPMIGDILVAMGAVYTAMAVTMIVMGVINRVKP